MRNIRVELTNERIIPSGGLSVVGAILGKSDFVKKLNRMDVTKKRSQHQIKNGDILLTYIGMLAMGKPQFDSVNELHDDKDFYKHALGIVYDIPSEATLRQRMDDIGNTIRKQIQEENVNMLKSNGITPDKSSDGMVHVDLDVSPHDNSKTKKEGVSRTYKGCDGYAPMHAYIGTPGYFINTELRAGSQHSQKGTPEFLRETVALCRQVTDEPLLFRMDSGNDAAENMGILLESGCFFNIKHNLRKEGKDSWYEMAKQHCKNIASPREGKTVYTGSDWRDIAYKTEDGADKTVSLRIVYEIIVRDTDKFGQYLFEPQVEVNTFWTNLGMSDQEVIDNYHAHGECEQYHSELKTDMDLERLPSGKFYTNALVLELSMLAFNILRMIGQKALGQKNPRLKQTVQRRRHRTVINDLINMACHITEHARQMVIGLGRSNVWRDVFLHVHNAFA